MEIVLRPRTAASFRRTGDVTTAAIRSSNLALLSGGIPRSAWGVSISKRADHADYEKALPEVVTFYEGIRRVSSEPFDVERAARLELDWWIVHRERASHPPDDLDRKLAELQAELYHLPSERVMEHARLRAEAMLIRDRAAGNGGPTGEQWAEIDRLLRSSWRSLWEVVHAR